jgi:hypothetical protein
MDRCRQPPGVEMARSAAQKESAFFFEKKNQKTFDSPEVFMIDAQYQVVKVFCFFFSKKKAFLACGH